MNSKHHLAGLLLITILILPFLGTFGWLMLEKSHIKKSVKQRLLSGMEKNDLILLKFNSEDIVQLVKWEHDLEFEYEDQMYDVVDSKSVGDSTFLWCWADNQESALNARIEQLVEFILGNDPIKTENSKRLEDFGKNLYCNISTNSIQKMDSFHLNSAFIWQFLYRPPDLSFYTPPPESV